MQRASSSLITKKQEILKKKKKKPIKPRGKKKTNRKIKNDTFCKHTSVIQITSTPDLECYSASTRWPHKNWTDWHRDTLSQRVFMEVRTANPRHLTNYTLVPRFTHHLKPKSFRPNTLRAKIVQRYSFWFVPARCHVRISTGTSTEICVAFRSPSKQFPQHCLTSRHALPYTPFNTIQHGSYMV